MSDSFQPSEVIETGPVFITAKASKMLNHVDILVALRRHRNGDWGLVSEQEREANEIALAVGDRVVSTYDDRNQVQFWIITEPDSSYSTVRLPAVY